jgi:mannose-6-phosphate isomerase-like protein (cupin superfamily)
MIPRRAFVTHGGIAASAVITSHIASAQTAGSATPPKVVHASENTPLWVLGVRIRIIADAQATGGGYSVFEDLVVPGQGVPLHVHTREEETIFVLEGGLDVTLGAQTSALGVGDFVHMPRGVPHRFHNPGPSPTRMLLTYSPGGFEQLFVEIGTRATDNNDMVPPITPQEVLKAREVAARYGAKWL